MTNTLQLAGQFLIAMPELRDPNFFHSVTFLCEHDAEGAMGVMINRPLDITMAEVFRQMEITGEDPEILKRPVFFGGPVQCERGFVLHRPHGGWDATHRVTDDIGITTSRDIIEAIAAGKGPEKSLITLGYAGWGPGQLEQELADNAWFNAPVTETILFDLDHGQRWEAAAAATGVDVHRLSGDIGHA